MIDVSMHHDIFMLLRWCIKMPTSTDCNGCQLAKDQKDGVKEHRGIIVSALKLLWSENICHQLCSQ